MVPFAALAIGLTFIAMTAAGAQEHPGIEELMLRVGERVAEFYTRAANVICIETSTVQGVDLSYSPVGFIRTVESELRIETGTGQVPGEASVLRKIRKVNGRAPRERDLKDRAGCTDPNPLSSEPLTFLLPAHRSSYQFTIAGVANDRNEAVLMIDFESIDRRSAAELIEDPGGHDDCFDWSGHIASRGRIWVDTGNYNVRRVERRLRGPVDVKVPLFIQRRHHLDSWVVLMRDDLTIRYKPFAFRDPDEVLLLPESVDSFTLIRGGLQSTRRNHTYSDYKRFVAEGKVVTSSASPDAPSASRR